MSGSSSTMTIDLDDDDEQQFVNWLKDLISLLDLDVYYHLTHHFNGSQELYTLL